MTVLSCLGGILKSLQNYYTPPTKLGGGILESPCPSVCPSVCRRARLGKIARLGIGCRGGYFVPLGQPHSSLFQKVVNSFNCALSHLFCLVYKFYVMFKCIKFCNVLLGSVEKMKSGQNVRRPQLF